MITIDTIVYDTEGNILSGLYAWPEGSPQSQTYVIGNGELYMSNIPANSNIIFSWQGNQFSMPVNSIGKELIIDVTEQLDEVVIIGNSSSSKSKIWLASSVILGVLALGYLFKNGSNPKKISI